MTEVLILFGSNVDPEANSVAAAAELEDLLDDLRFSSAWVSSAVGAESAPAFINWVACGRTDLGPAELKFDGLRPIEERLGRVRSANLNAPRPADLDILLYGDLSIADPNAGLEIPDPDLVRHAYALVPAADVAPRMPVPGTGASDLDRRGGSRARPGWVGEVGADRTLAELATNVGDAGLRCLGRVTDLTT